MNRAVNLLETLEDVLQLLRRNPATSIADHYLDCKVLLSAKSSRFVEYVRCDCDGTCAAYLTAFAVRLDTAALIFLASPITYFGVSPWSTLNSNPRRTACKGSVFNGLYSLFPGYIFIRIICTIRFCLDSSVVTYPPALTFVTHSFITSFATVFSNIQRDSIIRASYEFRTGR